MIYITLSASKYKSYPHNLYRKQIQISILSLSFVNLQISKCCNINRLNAGKMHITQCLYND